jgi:hypothetical protein
MTPKFTESTVEAAALEWLLQLDYEVAAGPDLLDGLFAERLSAAIVVLEKRLMASLGRINPAAQPAALAEAYRQLVVVEEIDPDQQCPHRDLNRFCCVVERQRVEQKAPANESSVLPRPRRSAKAK